MVEGKEGVGGEGVVHEMAAMPAESSEFVIAVMVGGHREVGVDPKAAGGGVSGHGVILKVELGRDGGSGNSLGGLNLDAFGKKGSKWNSHLGRNSKVSSREGRLLQKKREPKIHRHGTQPQNSFS